MTDVSVSVVTLLDTSGSMVDNLPMLIIDGKAFVRSARPGDQIAVVQFQNSASMVYPAEQALATVDTGLTVTAAAATAIGGLTAIGMTEMYDAVVMANTVMQSSSPWPTQAYVLLTDSMYSTYDPAMALPATMPTFICGLGPYVSQAMVQGMLDKNPANLYIAAPNAYQMMQVFNSIRGLAAQAEVVCNDIDAYTGTDYTLTPVQVSGGAEESQVAVVWSNADLSYTSGWPDPSHVNIVLINPAGVTTSIQPVIADPGYAIFNLNSPEPGQWQVLAQYAAQAGTYATTAGFEFDTGLQLALEVPRTAAPGEPLTIRARLAGDGADGELTRVGIRLRAPRYDVAGLLERHAAAIDDHLHRSPPGADGDTAPARRLGALRELLRARDPGADPLAEAATFHPLHRGDDGAFQASLAPAPHGGNYTIEATARGCVPGAKSDFERAAMATIMVGGA